jgi:murein DD-endopeptidase MepM/ murein hydrolase activator NlpD
MSIADFLLKAVTPMTVALGNPLADMKAIQEFTPPSHYGMDFRCSEGTPVLAAANGKVSGSYTSEGNLTREEGPPWSYGERIVIAHADGISTTYNHLSQRLVEVGAEVVKGQQIGISGNTGFSEGPHLHFEVMQNGSYVDPRPFLVDFGISLDDKGKVIVGIVVVCIAAVTALLLKA